MNTTSKPKTTIPKDAAARYIVLYQLAQQENPTKRTISETTNIPPTTVSKIIDRLRKEFQMEIVFTRNTLPNSKPTKGNVGSYSIGDWGILDKEKFLEKYSYYHNSKPIS
jgi:hypothetical protein